MLRVSMVIVVMVFMPIHGTGLPAAEAKTIFRPQVPAAAAQMAAWINVQHGSVLTFVWYLVVAVALDARLGAGLIPPSAWAVQHRSVVMPLLGVVCFLIGSDVHAVDRGGTVEIGHSLVSAW